MTVTTLLLFMVLSQIAMAGYMLYSFNSMERGARKRNAEMRAYLDTTLQELERHLKGSPVPVLKRASGEN